MKQALLYKYAIIEDGRPLTSVNFTNECDEALISSDIHVKGKKSITNYTDTNDLLVVRKTYTEDETLMRLNILFEWFNEDVEVVASKNKTIQFSDAQWVDRAEKQRKFIFSQLKARSIRLGASNYITLLYSVVHDELINFYETGSSMLLDRLSYYYTLDLSTIPVEQHQLVGTVKTILNTSLVIETPDVFNTIKDQIT